MSTQLFIILGAFASIIVATMNIILVFYVAPRLSKNMLLRGIVGIPCALAPITMGFWLSSVAFDRFKPTTVTERDWFLGIWIGSGLIALFASVLYRSVKAAKNRGN